MQRYKITHYYDQSLETVCDLLMESETPIYELVDLPNVSTTKPISEEDKGDKKYVKNEWCVHGQIPKIAQKIVKPEMLTFIEDSVWDRTRKTYTAKIIPHFFKKQLNARHKVEFFDNGDGRTKRILTGFIEIKIPVIGPVVELAIVSQLKDNAEADFKIGKDALDQYIVKYGDPHSNAPQE